MFLKLLSLAVVSSTLIISSFAQQPDKAEGEQLSARELYFLEKSSDHDNVPKLTKTAYKPDPKPKDTGSPKPPTKSSAPPAPVVPVVEHLGLRYRLLLVDKNSNAAKPVDAESVFHTGDCLALELEPNRTGYLYVLAKESTGNWNALFPSEQMDGESEIVRGRVTQRAPEKFCFELDENTGPEHLYVILSRNPAQVQDLNKAIIKNSDGPKMAAPESSTPAVMADASMLNKEVNDTVAELGSRGFKISKTSSAAPAEEKYSVYVVPASLEKKDTVFAEIKIKHQ